MITQGNEDDENMIILCKCEVIGEPGGGAGRTSKTTYEDCLGRASVAVDDARLPDSVVSGAGHLSVSSVGRGSDSSYISSSICLVNLEPFASSFKKKEHFASSKRDSNTPLNLFYHINFI